MKSLKIYISILCCFYVFSALSQGEDNEEVISISEKTQSRINPLAQKSYNEGVKYFSEGNYKDAIQSFKRAIEISPDFILARTNLAYTYISVESLDLAEEQFFKITSMDKTAHLPFFELGTIAELRNDSEKAILYYTKAIEMNKDDLRYFYHRGIQYFKLYEYKSAVEDFTKVISFNDDPAAAYNDRASAYKMSGQIDKAVADFNTAIEFNENFGLAYNNLGSLYREQKQYDKAITAYDKAISIDTNNYLAWNNRGLAKFEKGLYQEALADFIKVNELKPNYAIALNNIAGVYMEINEYESAITFSSAAIAINDNYGAAYYNRAIANEMLRKVYEACHDWNRAADLGIKVAEEFFTTHSCGNLIEK